MYIFSITFFRLRVGPVLFSLFFKSTFLELLLALAIVHSISYLSLIAAKLPQQYRVIERLNWPKPFSKVLIPGFPGFIFSLLFLPVFFLFFEMIRILDYNFSFFCIFNLHFYKMFKKIQNVFAKVFLIFLNHFLIKRYVWGGETWRYDIEEGSELVHGVGGSRGSSIHGLARGGLSEEEA